jgi:hypothetical protein
MLRPPVDLNGRYMQFHWYRWGWHRWLSVSLRRFPFEVMIELLDTSFFIYRGKLTMKGLFQYKDHRWV